MCQDRKLIAIPTGRSLGAEIRDVDLSDDLDASMIDAIKRALLEYLVLIFRDQQLTPAQQVKFARQFGALQRHDYVCALPDHPDLIEIRKEPHHVQNFGGVWHSDNSYLRTPPLGALLYAVEVPNNGGDTLWANQYSAYEHLPAQLKTTIHQLFAVHAPDAAFGEMRRLADESQAVENRLYEVVHPLVRTHPDTKRRSLFHSGLCTVRLKDQTISESKPLLDHLLTHATNPTITYRHRWRKRDVVFWDNRCTMHLAMNDYGGQRRIVHRVSIQGDVPI
jgi:taurine dioxygenase